MNSPARTDATSAPADVLGTVERQRRSELSRTWGRFKRYKPGVIALIFLGLLSILAIAPGLFEPYGYTDIDLSSRAEGPSWDHPMGFDMVGRDLLSRLIRGTRVAFLVGISATAIAVSIGVTVGATAGYFGGWVDSVLSRIVDSIMAFPLIVLLITLAAVVGPGVKTTVFVIGLTVWAQYARVVRAEVLSVRERDFVTSARSAGASDPRIIFRHILPNVLGPVIVIASLAVGGIIILEAALSFLGLGVQPPTPSWGGMLADARPFITTYPYMPIFPGVMIFLTVIAFNLLGDGLRDALDPRQRE
jgi:peptide/nickel transport system permease protein